MLEIIVLGLEIEKKCQAEINISDCKRTRARIRKIAIQFKFPASLISSIQFEHFERRC